MKRRKLGPLWRKARLRSWPRPNPRWIRRYEAFGVQLETADSPDGPWQPVPCVRISSPLGDMLRLPAGHIRLRIGFGANR